MPSASEKVINRALSGIEMKELIRRDFEKLLDGNGLLTDYTAYGRVSWRIVLSLDMDNFVTPNASTFVDSRRSAETGAEEFPVGGEIRNATELTHDVTSPNQERVRNGMAIPVEVKQHDGTTTVENVNYPESIVEEPAKTTITDVTNREKANWGKKL